MVLVHFGDAAPTLRCLASLAAVEGRPHKCVVVDNGSTPPIRDTLLASGFDAEVVEARHNPGFAAACNLGAQAALAGGATALWFLNNDAVVETPLLARFSALAEAHPEVALWGSHQTDRGTRLGADRQPAWFIRGLDALPALPPLEGAKVLGPDETLSGASIFVTRQAWEQVGPWPEWCFLYWEDAAWCRAARASGFALAILEEAVTHDRGTTIGRRSPLAVYYGTRNALLLHRALFADLTGERRRLALYGLQKRLFRGKWRELAPAWQGVQDALATPPVTGRHPRY